MKRRSRKEELGELVRVDVETDADRAQIAAKHYRSLEYYRVRVYPRPLRVEGETVKVYAVVVRRRRTGVPKGAL